MTGQSLDSKPAATQGGAVRKRAQRRRPLGWRPDPLSEKHLKAQRHGWAIVEEYQRCCEEDEELARMCGEHDFLQPSATGVHSRVDVGCGSGAAGRRGAGPGVALRMPHACALELHGCEIRGSHYVAYEVHTMKVHSSHYESMKRHLYVSCWAWVRKRDKKCRISGLHARRRRRRRRRRCMARGRCVDCVVVSLRQGESASHASQN
jgi:hypothetical protein